MKLAYRHILGDLVPAFLLSVVLFAGFIWIAGGPLLNAVNDLGNGAGIWIVLQLMGLYLPQMLVLAFPMAVLIAVIMGFNRLSAESEAVAMFASGISFYRMLLPTAGFALAVTVVGWIIGDSIEPAANARISYIKANVIHEVQATTDPFPLPPIRYSNKRLQALAWVDGGFDAATQELRGVTIVLFDPSSGRPTATIYGKTAKWLGGTNWQLSTVYVTDSHGVVSQIPVMTTGDIRQAPSTMELLQNSSEPDNLSFAELAGRIGTLEREGAASSKSLREAQVSLWEKIALPLACLVFALVGAPLALKPQRAASRGASVAYGVGIILAYYSMFKYLDIAGANGSVDPALAAFLPNVVGIALAAYLISKATT